MKIKLILSAFILGSALSISAQTENSGTSRQNIKSKPKTEKADVKDKAANKFPSQKLITDLSLSEKQVSEMEAVRKSERESLDKFRKENCPDQNEKSQNRELMKKEMEKLRKESDDKFKKILSSEQYKKFKEIQETERKNRGNRPHGDVNRRNNNRPQVIQ